MEIRHYKGNACKDSDSLKDLALTSAMSKKYSSLLRPEMLEGSLDDNSETTRVRAVSIETIG